MSSIIRTTRASAAHLATAQRHHGATRRAREEAERLEHLAKTAMTKHDKARALLGG